jgi:hypothetical protein
MSSPEPCKTKPPTLRSAVRVLVLFPIPAMTCDVRDYGDQSNRLTE